VLPAGRHEEGSDAPPSHIPDRTGADEANRDCFCGPRAVARGCKLGRLRQLFEVAGPDSCCAAGSPGRLDRRTRDQRVLEGTRVGRRVRDGSERPDCERGSASAASLQSARLPGARGDREPGIAWRSGVLHAGGKGERRAGRHLDGRPSRPERSRSRSRSRSEASRRGGCCARPAERGGSTEPIAVQPAGG